MTDVRTVLRMLAAQGARGGHRIPFIHPRGLMRLVFVTGRMLMMGCMSFMRVAAMVPGLVVRRVVLFGLGALVLGSVVHLAPVHGAVGSLFRQGLFSREGMGWRVRMHRMLVMRCMLGFTLLAVCMRLVRWRLLRRVLLA